MKKIVFALIPLFLLVSCGGSNESQEEQTPEVKVAVVSSRDCDVDLKAPAQLRGKEDVAIIPQVEALLEKILVHEGQQVKKGQQMFILDRTAFQAVYDDAKARVSLAQAQVKTSEIEEASQKELFDKNIIAEHQYKVAANQLLMSKAQLEEAKAALKHAKNDLDHTVICSPNDGVVGNINYRTGSLVNQAITQPITIVSDNSTIYAYCSITETNYRYLMQEAGSTENLIANLPDCRLEFSDGSIYEQTGRVETVSGLVDKETGALSVRVAFPNDKGLLSAGGSGTVVITFKENGVVIPRSATYEIQDKTYVYKIEQDGDKSVAKTAMVEVYRLNEDEYIVYEGLKDGDTIAIEGVRKMTNDMELIPVMTADTVKVVKE
ncbi:MAG: efflux RND transporter periplasmic adaptor subunit [Paludibacteraceae bacterium]|nr:efflux RND transporter periplasmic adaptor subunit [Paludibacteraceae bacterium]